MSEELKPRCFAYFDAEYYVERKCQWCTVENECMTGTTPLQNKPLTDEEIKMMIPKGDVWKYEVGFTAVISFARAIEAAHGIKE